MSLSPRVATRGLGLIYHTKHDIIFLRINSLLFLAPIMNKRLDPETEKKRVLMPSFWRWVRRLVVGVVLTLRRWR